MTGLTMGRLIPLLVALCALSTFAQDENYDYSDYDITESPTVSDEMAFIDWLFELLDIKDSCALEPCKNGARCENTASGEFKCHCNEPFTGETCQQVKSYCKDVTCGRGSCVFKSSSPYYECKCKHPYKPPNCKREPLCDPNPCQNGGACVKGTNRRRPSFKCSCPSGYTGKFCEVGPDDCYQQNGESYRGTVSVTVDGDECLDWNSYFVMQKAGDMSVEYAGFDGVGPHNFCRNPDGDSQPWCFYKQNRNLKWNYCDVRECSTDTVTPTHDIAPPTTSPTKPDVPAPSSPFSQCGKPHSVRAPRIFGGKKSFPGAHPWQVSLQVRANSGANFSHECGGILLSSCWVLTAAHCIGNDAQMQVVLGGVTLDKHEAYDQIIPVEKAIVHENYTVSPFALYNDIAMLKLKVTDESFCAKETPFVKTACLPEQTFQSGTDCVLSGWGVTETKRSASNDLLHARVLLISQEKCNAPHVYADSLDDSMFCAGYMAGGVDSCQGDSGGPLICESNGTHYVVGVVSWGDGCGKKYKPGVYANVIKYNSWINNHLNS